VLAWRGPCHDTQVYLISEGQRCWTGSAAIGGRGIRLLDARPRHGSLGAAIAFLHPADVGGVLTELVQAADSAALPG
jgi:hypothetical protein